METSPVTSRHSVRVLLALCLVGSLLAFGFVLMRSGSPAGFSSLDVPLPFGGASTTIRGQLTDIGFTTDNRRIVDMEFPETDTTENFGQNDLTFVLTPELPETFSAGAPLLAALTPNKRFYGYKYTSREATVEIERAQEKKSSSQTGEEYDYDYLFPGKFFASEAALADDNSFVNQFMEDRRDANGNLTVDFLPLSEVTLDANARYLIIAEEEDISITVRGLLWCGDGTLSSDGADTIPDNADDEFCDDGNTADNDGCTSCIIDTDWTCNDGSPTVCQKCGNGIKEGTEACDDANDVPNDGCTSCQIDTGWSCNDVSPTECYECGNGTKEGTEACDDGDLDPGDGCSATCTVEPAWTCDAASPTICQLCGNGEKEGTEACDDANDVPNDGCTSCQIDTGWSCNDGSPTVCQKCGNGIKEGTEACDDANDVPNDGCTSCQIDTGWSCNDGSPTVCQKCGDGIQQSYGFDGLPGIAGIDDDADGVIDNEEEWLAEGSDDEQCDAGAENGKSSCSTECRVIVPIPIN